MWKGFAVLVHSNFQPILIECILDILQPLLADAIQEHKCGPADGMPIVHVLLTKSAPFCRLMSTPGNILTQQSGHNRSHQGEVKLIMGEKAGLSS